MYPTGEFDSSLVSQVTLSLWSIILFINRSRFGYIQLLDLTKLKRNVATINNNIVILTIPIPIVDGDGVGVGFLPSCMASYTNSGKSHGFIPPWG